MKKKSSAAMFRRMESLLENRDKVGVSDAILLQDYTSEKAFLDNLSKRYHENIIYTYIGNVLVAVNPYRDLGLYTEESMEAYRQANIYQVPPSIYALSEVALRALLSENADQCVLISGESGSGKTESSKHILQYIAAAIRHSDEINMIRDRLLRSNPVLEAFGNAKTNRNDNSSRFGKYMDIECNYKGDPVGGNILNYLLEKSRVVHQERGERNFHVFYQLLAGASPQLRSQLHLSGSPDDYTYLCQGKTTRAAGIDDAENFATVVEALEVLGFGGEAVESLWRVVAAILHLGNVTFQGNEHGRAFIVEKEHLRHAAELLQCEVDTLEKALSSRTISAQFENVSTHFTVDQATYCRESLTKSIYERMFDWLVRQVNVSLQAVEESHEKRIKFGILDIYGFEIFTKNGYEQFCINYCNEKLQQLFIELTLRSEQEEYKREGIEWEEITYFDNKIICDLIEEKHKGMIAIMDEECLRPGSATDITFLDKLNRHLKDHDHFSSYDTTTVDKVKKTFKVDDFRLVHYAGEVTYSVNNFLDKNNDLLYRDLKLAMSTSKNAIISQLYTKAEVYTKKMPLSAGTQFKTSLSHLMDTLLTKQPSYVRCIKPNDQKKAMKFDDELVGHQVQYLGLMENVRVRRAGFAFRRPFVIFLARYKSLCPSTWPRYDGPAKDGVRLILESLGLPEDEYRLGVTKVFIRYPVTLFQVEDRLKERKHELASFLQARVKRVLQRRRYLRTREAIITVQSCCRQVLAQRKAKLRRWAVVIVRSFLKGFMTRNDETITDINRRFQTVVKAEWLGRLSRSLPTNVLDKSWPPCPTTCTQASEILREMHQSHMARSYVTKLSPARKTLIEEKILSETLFKGKKTSFEKSLHTPFKSSHLNDTEEKLVKTKFDVDIKKPGEKVEYSTSCVKYDRHGYKPRDRMLVITNKTGYLLECNKEATKLQLKNTFVLEEAELIVSQNKDDLLLIHQPIQRKGDKGDLILNLPHVIEIITKIVQITGKQDNLKIADSESVEHSLVDGKKGTIYFNVGNTSSVDKSKAGLMVVAAH